MWTMGRPAAAERRGQPLQPRQDLGGARDAEAAASDRKSRCMSMVISAGGCPSAAPDAGRRSSPHLHTAPTARLLCSPIRPSAALLWSRRTPPGCPTPRHAAASLASNSIVRWLASTRSTVSRGEVLAAELDRRVAEERGLPSSAPRAAAIRCTGASDAGQRGERRLAGQGVDRVGDAPHGIHPRSARAGRPGQRVLGPLRSAPAADRAAPRWPGLRSCRRTPRHPARAGRRSSSGSRTAPAPPAAGSAATAPA